jgi:hypothetical protein
MNEWLRLLLKIVLYPFYLKNQFIFRIWRPFYTTIFAEELEFSRDKKNGWYSELGMMRVLKSDKSGLPYGPYTVKNRSPVVFNSVLDKKRIKLLDKWGWKCFLCGVESNLTIDHFVIPCSDLIKQGKSRWHDYLNNCRPLCVECHLKKDSKKRV